MKITIKIFFNIGVFLSFVSCNGQNKQQENFSILGHVKNIPTKKVYLIEAYSHDVLDSASYQNNTFVFDLKRDLVKDPLLVSVIYFEKGKKQFILIRDPTSPKGKPSNYNSSFMTENGSQVKLEGKLPNDVTVNGGIQNETFYKYGNSSFGFLPQEVPKRQLYFERYKKLIEQYPSSFSLLNLIKNQRATYSNKELNNIISSFDDEVQVSESAKYLKNFTKLRNEKGSAYKQLVLQDNQGRTIALFNPESKLNVTIFWASWCGPCRAEILDLKQMIAKYKDKSISFSNVSIDKKKIDWIKALAEENMSWTQLLVKQDELEKTNAIFNLSGIPLIIITNQQKIELARFTGNNHINDIEKTIVNYFNKS